MTTRTPPVSSTPRLAGGNFNTAAGAYSFAAGRRAQAVSHGSFVWGGSTDADFTSTGDGQFLIRGPGGVSIGTASPSEQLHMTFNLRLPATTATQGITRSGGNRFLNISQNLIEDFSLQLPADFGRSSAGLR